MSDNTGSRRRVTRRKPAHQPKGRLKAYAVMFTCLMILVAGFFLAARQHFASIDFSIRNSRLRRQLDELETEKRRLMVAREVSLSPSEIRKAAKKLALSGFDPELTSFAASPNEIKPVEPRSAPLVKPIVSSAPVGAPSASTSARLQSDRTPRPTPVPKSTNAERNRIVGMPLTSANPKRQGL